MGKMETLQEAHSDMNPLRWEKIFENKKKTYFPRNPTTTIKV